jgi:hypothetical protein
MFKAFTCVSFVVLILHKFFLQAKYPPPGPINYSYDSEDGMPELDVSRSDFNCRKRMFHKQILKPGRGNARPEDDIHSTSESEDNDDLPIGSIKKLKQVKTVERPAVKNLIGTEEPKNPTEKVGKKLKDAKKPIEEPIGSIKKSKKFKVQKW